MSFNLYWVNADGTGEVTRLTDSPDTNSSRCRGIRTASSWRSRESRRPTGIDLMMLPMEGDAARGWTPGTPTVFLATPAIEVLPSFSPDGRWLAYQSNEGGLFDIYVRAFPGPGGKWRVSSDGGIWPTWSPASRELLFLNASKVMVAPYTVDGDSFKADKPQLWSPIGYQSVGGAGFGPYAVHPDGKRLALAAAEQTAPGGIQDKVVFISNFFDYLNKIAPSKK